MNQPEDKEVKTLTVLLWYITAGWLTGFTLLMWYIRTGGLK